MPNVLVNDDSLKAIGNAIRAKNGETTTYKPAEMAAAITAISGGSSGYVPTDADLKLTGDCSNLFNSGKLKWIIDNYGNRITTEKISSTAYMFSSYKGNCPSIQINSDYELRCNYMFYNAKATIGYAKDQANADKFNNSSNKPSGLTFVVK